MSITRVLRALAMVVGLAALGLTLEALISGASEPLTVLWYWPGSTLSALSAWRQVELPSNLLRIMIAQITTHIAAIGLSLLLAARINRHFWDWALLALLFPPTVALLSLVRFGTANQDRWGGVLGRIAHVMTSVSHHKRCGRCDKTVPLHMRVHDACPHCGTIWTEMKTVVSKYPGGSS